MIEILVACNTALALTLSPRAKGTQPVAKNANNSAADVTPSLPYASPSSNCPTKELLLHIEQREPRLAMWFIDERFPSKPLGGWTAHT